MDRKPEISVVVPSHDRPLRLRWLLNALEEQTLPRERWEIVVGHDSSGPETEELLRTHPLAVDGTLRHVTLEPGSAPPGRNRNAAWRMARAPLILFTDDDCRPPVDWLENALMAAETWPGTIVQGKTRPDPVEDAMSYAWHAKTQNVLNPPTPWCEACNILYPRSVLEEQGGFDETMYVGEDTELALRAREAGVPYEGAREMLTFHAHEQMTLAQAVRGAWRWQQLPELVRRRPEMREAFPGGYFWKRTHFWLPVAVAGWFLERRSRAWGLLMFPYAMHAIPEKHSHRPRGRIRALMQLPGQAAIDVSEMAALAWGSIRHRKFLI